jgi:hypothetical protein
MVGRIDRLRLRKSHMDSNKTIGTRFATRFATGAVLLLVAVLLLIMVGSAAAQTATDPYFYRWDNGGGNNNWGTGTNWGPNPPGNFGVNNFTPNAFYQEMGLINNGNVVNVTTSQTQFNGSAADNATGAAGVTIDALATPAIPAGNGSRLNIASGGSLTLYVTYGAEVTPPGPPGTLPRLNTGHAIINNFGQLTIQPGGTLTAQADVAVNAGSLTVGGAGVGGTLVARNLHAPGANSTVSLSGSAAVNLSASAILNGTTTITGPNVVVNSAGLSMSTTTVFSPVITNAPGAGGSGHSVINVLGGASLNGTIRPQFQNGVVPQLGSTWTLFDAGQIQGNFTISDSTGTGAALPTGLRYAMTTTKVGSVRGVKGQLTVENFLTAEVNRANGEVKIRNTNTTVGTGVEIGGYQIGSFGGALRPMSFTPAFGGAWQSANPTNNSLAALNTEANSNVGLNAAHSLGNIYDPVQLQTTFGTTPVSDLTFSYTRSDGRTVTAPVTYINTGLANTFVLQVDPTDGKARIVNDSIHNNIQFDGYQITSASNSLLPTWNSLQDQMTSGWEEAAPTTASIAELNTGGTKTVNAGQTAATMTGLFKTAGSMQDLIFQFRVPGTGEGTGILNGVVRYVPFNAGVLIGDYNSNGTVDAADYTLWRNRVGQPGNQLPNRDPANGSGAIDGSDYLSWKRNFGSTMGAGSTASTSVPEPSSFAIAGLAVGAICLLSRRVGEKTRRRTLGPVPVSHLLRGLV